MAGRLPHEVTSFVGRRRAKADLKRALSASRLVTLTGSGGVGKTRLALQLAHELRRAFPDGVWLVELVKLQDPALVPQAVVAALDLRDQSTRTPETVLVDYLATKHLLLVMDNCEHVVDACGRLVHTVLAAAPDLRVLATSREPLSVQGEYVWPVSPLTVPATDAELSNGSGREFEALALFEDRVNAVLPGFRLAPDNEAVVAQLCRRLDGVPLAIELAAVRARQLSVDQILGRLEDRFRLLTAGNRAALPRHQTLRAAVDWSYQLCDEQGQLLWARCSVFAGDFDLDAAESVCGGNGINASDVFTGIIELVEKSILNRSPGTSRESRYQMLDTIRAYGRERLAEAGEENVLRRHRDYYLRLAEQAEAESGGSRQHEWAERLRVERANFFAALDYCTTVPGQQRDGLRLGAALWFYWIACGFVRDGRYWLDRALAADPAPSRERVKALWANGWGALLQGDNEAALVLLEESRNLAQEQGDDTDLAYATQFLGWAKMMIGDLPDAIALFDQAHAHHRASRQWTTPALIIFPEQEMAAGLAGDTGHAMALLDECRNICTRLGERWVLSWALCLVGITWWVAGNRQLASDHLCEALRVKRQVTDLHGYAVCVELLSWVAAAEGDWARAAVLQGAADTMWESIGTPLWGNAAWIDEGKQWRTRAREALGERAYQTATEHGAGMPVEEVIAEALGDKPSTRAAEPEPPVAMPGLTKREREVASLIVQGLTNKEIATRLVISQRTAETHVEHILTKLGFTSRTQIVSWSKPSHQ